MNRYYIFFGLIFLLSGLLLFSGCTQTNIPGLPFSVCQLINRGYDASGNHLDCNSFYNGFYDGNFFSVTDGNIVLSPVPSFDINSADINWGQIINFPSGCADNQAVKIVGSSLVCIDLPTDTNCALNNSCSNIVYAIDLNTLIDENTIIRTGDNISELNNNSGYITSYTDTNCAVNGSCPNIIYGDYANTKNITTSANVTATNVNVSSTGAYLFDSVNGLYLSKGTESVYYSLGVGLDAGNRGVANRQTAIGWQAGKSATGQGMTMIGLRAGYQSTGRDGFALGYRAGELNSGIYQTSIGYFSGYKNTGENNIGIGYYSGRENKGNDVLGIGYQATYLNDANNVIGIGYRANESNTGDNVIALGYEAGLSNSTDNLFILKQANVNATPLIQGDFSSGDIELGGNLNLDSDHNVYAGDFIELSHVADFSKSSLDTYFKDVETWTDSKDKINYLTHPAGVSFVTLETDFSKPVVVVRDSNTCDVNDLCEIVRTETITYPFTKEKINYGLSYGVRVSELEKMVWELSEQNKDLNGSIQDLNNRFNLLEQQNQLLADKIFDLTGETIDLGKVNKRQDEALCTLKLFAWCIIP